MKINFRTLAITLLLVCGFATTALHAQDAPAANKTTVSIETDPSTFAFGGYAFHFRIKLANCKHFVAGAGTYGMDYPSFLVDMNSKNKSKGWDVRINSAYAVFGEYYFKEPNQKWFAGLQAGVQNYKISNDGAEGEESKYSNLLIMPSIGYTWQPFKVPFYIKPWAGIGFTSKISGDNTVQNLEYNISPVVPFVTLHIGYTF